MEALEVRLHSVEGLPSTGAVVFVRLTLAGGTSWCTAGSPSVGGCAYVGAWVRLPAEGHIKLRVSQSVCRRQPRQSLLLLRRACLGHNSVLPPRRP